MQVGHDLVGALQQQGERIAGGLYLLDGHNDLAADLAPQEVEGDRMAVRAIENGPACELLCHVYVSGGHAGTIVFQAPAAE